VRRTEPEASQAEDLGKEVVRDLYQRSRSAILVLVAVLLMFRWAMGSANRTDGHVRILFSLLIALSVLRWLWVMVPARRRDAWMSLRTQYLAFAAGVVLNAGLFCALIVQAWPILDTAHIGILAAVVSGVVSGAIMSLGSSLFIYLLYMVPIVGAMVVMAALDHRPAWGADLLATASMLYAVTAAVLGLDHARIRRRSIRLGLELSDLILRDTLTELRNRRFLQEYMTVEQGRLSREATDIERAKKTERDEAVAIYIIDLDHFKGVNDTHGHAAGDMALKQLADVLVSSVRRSDVLVRWGGEEFVLVARIRRRDHVRIIAETLRHRVASGDFRLPDGAALRQTCSLGFCVLPFFPDQPRKLNWEQALGLADAALYIAKQEGRNRWVGVGHGATVWDDTPLAYVAIRDDLLRACERGEVTLERTTS
jgi:diguanylate cyclase (GGDEF)-like protein